MLLELNLKNYAIIDSLNLSFNSGLNIITGETGTGKSIIVDALGIILGDTSNSDQIKYGCNEAVVEAVFDITAKERLKITLEEHGFDTASGLLTVRRILSRQNRSRIYINDSNSSLRFAGLITRELVDIFSQHEHQSLLKTRNHLKYLDDYNDNSELKNKLKKVYDEYKLINKQLEELNTTISERSNKEDYIKFQLEELRSLDPAPGEDDILEKEEKLLSNAEQIAETMNEAERIIYEGESSVYEILNRTAKQIRNISDLDSSLEEITRNLENISILINEASYSIRDYTKNIVYDPSRLEQVSNRLSELNHIKRKYKTDIQGLIDKKEQLENELAGLRNVEENTKDLILKKEKLESTSLLIAKDLSARRKTGAKDLCDNFNKEAEHVGLKNAVLEIFIEEKELSADGIDRIEFRFSANPGEPPREISRVASGGELSRIMLLLKEMLTESERKSVLIFDEADSGIGGAVAESIGKKIKNLSRNNQVLCITHLPQVAKFADTHFLVNKTALEKDTKIDVKVLSDTGRVKEIGRMLAGRSVTDKTLEAAREMLGKIHSSTLE